MRRILSTWAALFVAAAFSLSSAGAAENPAIPPGTLLRVRLDTTITSKTNKAGDAFQGMVMEDAMSGQDIAVPKGSLVAGHIAFLKPAGRIKAKAQMRIVLDSITTPEDKKVRLSSTLEDTRGGVCGSTSNDEEGTIVGCGKSKKEAVKDSAMGAAMGAGAGGAVGIGHEIDCRYYGNCGGPSMGGDILYGAAIGASTALVYNIFKHQKEIILVAGTELMFVVNRTAESTGSGMPHEISDKQPPTQPAAKETPHFL